MSSESEKELGKKDAAAKRSPVEEFDPYAKSWQGSQYGSR